MMKAIVSIVFIFTCLVFFPFSAIAIPTLGVAPGVPDSTTANLSYDGFPMPLSGGDLTIWYGSDSGNIKYGEDNDLWLLTTSAAGGTWTFTIDSTQLTFTYKEDLHVASYKDPVYGVNLTDSFAFHDPPEWQPLDQTFYSYEFGTGSKEFYYITGTLSAPGIEIGDWMYAVLEGNSVDDFSPKTTSSFATPEPASMLLLGSGLLGLAGFGRRKFFKK